MQGLETIPFELIEGAMFLSPINKVSEILGVTYMYLLSKSSRNDSDKWRFTKRSGKLMLSYDSLSPKYKAVIKEKFGCPYEHLRSLEEERRKEQTVKARINLVKSFEVQPSTDEYYEIKAKWHDKTPDAIKDIDALLYACAVVKWCSDAKKHTANRLGFDKKAELLIWVNELPEIRENKFLKGATSLVSFRRKMKAYKEKGWQGLVSGKIGNKSAAKISTEEQKRTIRTLYNQHTAPDFQQVAVWYNQIAIEKQWKTVTPKTIENYLKTPGVMMVASTNRLALRDWEGKNVPSIPRYRPSEAGLLWVADATPAELYYQEDGKTWKRLNLCLVIDAYNDCIVGWSIDEKENADMITRAWKMAIANTGLLPVEAKMDRFALKSLTPFYNAISLHVRASRAGNAKDKIIEPMFRRLNESEFKQFSNWAGSGIRAKQDKSQPNSDFIKLGKQFFPDRQGAIDQILTSIQSWNSTKNRYDSFMESQQRNPKVRDVTKEQLLDIFGVYLNHSYQYNNMGIGITVEGKRQYYQAWGNLDAHSRLVGIKGNKVKMLPEDPSLIRVESPHGDVLYLNQTEREKMAYSDQTEGDRARLNLKLNFQKEIIERAKRKAEEDREGIALPRREAEALTKGFFTIGGGNKGLLHSSEDRMKSFEEEQPEEAKDFYDQVTFDPSKIQEVEEEEPKDFYDHFTFDPSKLDFGDDDGEHRTDN